MASPLEDEFKSAAALQATVELIEKVDDPVLRSECAAHLIRRTLRHRGASALTAPRLLADWQRLVSQLIKPCILRTREPTALAHIAELDLSVLILPAEFNIEQSTKRISVDDGRQILRALAPIIAGEDKRDSQASGRLAAEVVSAMGPKSVVEDELLQELPIFRVWSAHKGAYHSIPASRLMVLRNHGLAFQKLGMVRPQQAARVLYAVLADKGLDVVLVEEDIAEPLQLSPIRPDTLLTAIQGHSVSDQPAERQALLGLTTTNDIRSRLDSRDPQAAPLKEGLRLLLHGNNAQRESKTKLWKSGETEGLQHESVRLVLEVSEKAWTLLSEELTQALSEQWMRCLDVRTLGQHQLVELIERLSHQEMAELGRRASKQDCISLLRATSREETLWCRLPLHHTVTGLRLPIVAGETWLHNPAWPVSSALAESVKVVAPSADAQDYAIQQKRIALWSAVEQVKFILARPSPEKHASACLDAMQELGEEEWPEELKSTPWLPTERSGDDTDKSLAIAPGSLLGLPPTAAALVYSKLRGHTEAFLAPLEVHASIRSHPIFPRVVASYALRGADLIGALSLEWGRASTTLALGHDADKVPFEDALDSEGLQHHPGWALVRALNTAPDCREALQAELIPVLSSPMSFSSVVKTLNALADAAERLVGEAGQRGWRVYTQYLDISTKVDDFTTTVLPQIRLKNRAGRWVSAKQIARSGENWAPEYRLHKELRRIINPVLEHARSTPSEEPVVDSSQVPRQEDLERERVVGFLEEYFEPWFRRGIRQEAVGLLIALMGSGDSRALWDLADNWLTPHQAEGRWDWVFHKATNTLSTAMDSDHGRLSRDRYAVREYQSEHTSLQTVSLINTQMQARLASGQATDTIFAGLDAQGVGRSRPYWLNFLPVPEDLPREERNALLRRSIESFVRQRLRRVLLPQQFEPIWTELSQSGQAQIGAVRKQILGNLSTHLQVLSYKQHTKLARAVMTLKRAKQRAAEALETFAGVAWAEKVDKPKQLLAEAEKNLTDLVTRDAKVQDFLLEQIRKKLIDYQYGTDRILWELLQNADDAIVQRQQMLSGRGEAVSRFRIEVEPGKLRIIHWGRQINQHTMAGFHQGQERGWDLDLLNMMVLNTSDKMPEHGTTGRFGLGFKSVYLISDRPRIGSGQLAFEVTAGMLPEVLETSPIREKEWSTLDPPTVFELPLRPDVAPEELLTGMKVCGGLATLFCRAITEVELVQDERWIAKWDPRPVPGIPEMQLGVLPLGLEENQPLTRVLRLQNDTVAVVLVMSGGRFISLPERVPTLWNTAPTKEHWGFGIALNGALAVDPGRSRVALDREETEAVFVAAGQLINRALGTLFERLQQDWSSLADALELPPSHTPQAEHALWESLWSVLAQAQNAVHSAEKARIDLVRKMHGSSHGLHALVRRHPILPSGLPGAFKTLTRLAQVKYVVSGELKEKEVLEGVHNWGWLGADFTPGAVIAEDVMDIIQTFKTDIHRPSELRLDALLQRWGAPQGVTLERAIALQVLIDWFSQPFMQTRTREEIRNWMSGLLFPSDSGTASVPGKLLLPVLGREIEEELRELGELDRLRKLEDEHRRAKFAPPSALLTESFCKSARAVRFFLACRKQLSADRNTVEQWIRSAHGSTRQEAALRYCVEGEFAHELCKQFRRKPIPWFPDRNALHLSSLVAGWSRAEKVDLQNVLFPAMDLDVLPSSQDVVSPQTARQFFQRFDAWWAKESTRRSVLERYTRRVWPNWLLPGLTTGLRNDDDEQWLALLILGASRSIGMAEEHHHRGFLEEAQSQGWWDVFKTPEDERAWMEMLRSWQNNSIQTLDYARWMALFPTIYQLSRYLKQYRRLLRTAERRPPEMFQFELLLKPRMDSTLTGAGRNFDAPPAPLGLGLHWVLRELVRLEVIPVKEHLTPECWVPSAQVIEFLQRLGLDGVDASTANPDKARAIHTFLSKHLGEPAPTLHCAFDIPLRHVRKDANLMLQFGLEM